ncbi:hypothetical protein ACWEDZ_39235 [Streptomyces sp. NPDC005047]
MHQTLKRAANRRVVIAAHLSGFGGQCRLANARVCPKGLRELQRSGALLPSVVAKLHQESCEARTKLRREIRDMKLKRVAL